MLTHICIGVLSVLFVLDKGNGYVKKVMSELGGNEHYFKALNGMLALLTTIIADACSLFRVIRLFLNKESSYNMLFSNRQL